STGSIGVNTLEIVGQHPERFQVVALGGGRNLKRMEEQILRFRPKLVSVLDAASARALRARIASKKLEILCGVEGLVAVATHPQTDMVVSALSGSIGLIPTFAAIRARKTLAIANKEPLVMAGEILLRESVKRGVTILPIDSEHSAIFQSLAGHRKEDIKRLILTASGGPFLKIPLARLERVTPEQALRHPRWKMGKKVTLDSASLMNKALEVIEARWLFQVPESRIEVHIHPQSIVHSMVEYIDGSVVAQLALPDMRGPIAYALSYPERLNLQLPSLNLFAIRKLTFGPVEEERFPALGLAYRALEAGGTMPAVLNSANEAAAAAFLQGRISFREIPRLIRKVMDSHRPIAAANLQEIMNAHEWAQKKSRKRIDEFAKSQREDGFAKSSTARGGTGRAKTEE
ncbi:MAG: dxr, partial [Deltaproteobacteria bacterium]|nr:dxr [Deltaproteobacteria bacterium]